MTRPFTHADHGRRFRHVEYGYVGILEFPPASTLAARPDEAVLWHDGERTETRFPSNRIYVRPGDVEAEATP